MSADASLYRSGTGFHDDFARVLYDAEAPVSPAVAALACQPGFAVYRNTVIKGCVDALRANYPSVARLVGEEWFVAAADVYVRRSPPAQATLLRYGADFAAFLADFAPAAELPWLAGVAALDRMWTEAHVAADEAALDAAALAALAPEALGGVCVRPHVAARWAWFDSQPAGAIWRRTREAEPLGELPWQGEGCLISRPNDTVRWAAIDAAGCAFLQACAPGSTLAAAAAQVLARWPQADLAAILAGLLGAGALFNLETDP